MKNKKAEANTKSVKTANNKIKKVEDQTMKGKGKEKEEVEISEPYSIKDVGKLIEKIEKKVSGKGKGKGKELPVKVKELNKKAKGQIVESMKKVDSKKKKEVQSFEQFQLRIKTFELQSKEAQRWAEWIVDNLLKTTNKKLEIVPVVVITFEDLQKQKCKGKFNGGSWIEADGTVMAHIRISQRYFGNVKELVQVLIHEMNHLWNHVNGIKDCNSKGRFHNSWFGAKALQCGFEFEGEFTGENAHLINGEQVDGWSKKVGWGYTKLSAKLEKLIETKLKPNADLFTDTLREFEEERKPSTVRIWRCNCGSRPLAKGKQNFYTCGNPDSCIDKKGNPMPLVADQTWEEVLEGIPPQIN